MAKTKVKIQYGVLSGERNGVRIRKQLKHAGYQVVKKRSTADIIIAHSAGCFWLPDAPTVQKLVLIDPPYWPGRTIRERGKVRVRTNFKFREYGYAFRYWLIRNIWGIYYLIRDAKRTRRIVKHATAFDLPSIIRGHTVILVRNEHDDWLTPDLGPLMQAHPKLQIRYMPGDHEHFIYHPKAYVDLLQLFPKE
jgi:hypothetical protein